MMVVHQPQTPKPADPTVEAELDRLAVMPIAQLRARYRELFRADPPKAFGPNLLRRSVAQRIQERAYGSLPRATQRLLDQMIKAFAARPDARIVLPRRIKAGSVLVRQWKGQSHRIMVLAEGFAYDGNTYSNLSEIAGLITGTKWNGPRFFGLRGKSDDDSTAVKAASPQERRQDSDTKARRRHFGGGSDYRRHNAELSRRPAAHGAG
jgi:Protein of unknown function (DUF2924)